MYEKLSLLPWEEVTNARGITRSSIWMTANDCSCTYRYGRKDWAPSDIPLWIGKLGDNIAGLLGVPPQQLNSVNLNKYSNYQETLWWHADNEPLFTSRSHPECLIISLSLGSSRPFSLRRNFSDKSVTTILSDGDIFIMDQLFQLHYEHKVDEGDEFDDDDRCRYNLTFRYIKSHGKKCKLRKSN